MQAVSELEIYIHIPFCVRKCSYCDFLSFPLSDGPEGSDRYSKDKRNIMAGYLSSLRREIGMRYDIEVMRESDRRDFLVTSVFLGGGTPTVLEPEDLITVLDQLKKVFRFSHDAEITVECNPGTVTAKDLLELRQGGFNRISLGLQSALDKELRRIGRIHTFGQFEDTYCEAVNAGFDNINVDLISALPGQRMSDVDESLKKVLDLSPRPKHISAYSLILEEGTPFMDLYNKGCLDLPDEDTERRMHWDIIDTLKKNGYNQYELSNLSVKGYECRHNIGYWTGKEYLGFGLGAASLFSGRRYSVTRDLAEYQAFYSGKEDKNTDKLNDKITFDDLPFSEIEVLTDGDKMAEFMFLGLRMEKGISFSEFEKRFGKHLMEIYGEAVTKHIGEGLLVTGNGRLKLTRRGQDVSNYVFCDFV